MSKIISLDSDLIASLANAAAQDYFDSGYVSEKWGPEWRQHTVSDAEFTLQHLFSAVSLDNYNLFLDYFKWLVVLLVSRNVKKSVTITHTKILISVLEKQLLVENNPSRKTLLAKSISFLQKALGYIKTHNVGVFHKNNIFF